MFVGSKMTPNPFTVKKEDSVAQARNIMKREKIHRLPVINSKGCIVGIITEKDILYASPSPASSLDVYEIHSLFAKLTVDKVMKTSLITVSPDTLVEEAAMLMADNNIGGLPVVKDSMLTGIITESDIFKVFVELFSFREPGIRVSALVPKETGELAKLSHSVSSKGGNFVSFGTVRGENPTNTLAVFKVQDLTREQVIECITPFVQEIKDIKEIT